MRTSQLPLRRRTLVAGTALGLVGGMGLMERKAVAQAPVADDPWPALAAQIFNNRPLLDGNGLLAIDAPYRAEDAAVVPISLRLLRPVGDAQRIQSVTVVIDQNPSPLVARITLGENSGIQTLSTRARVDSYTKVHAVAERDDHQLFVTERFVKAAGGCSAPAAKQDTDAIPLGTMRFRQFAPSAGQDSQEAELLIRHPNYSGMQMDQLTRLYVPAHFVSSIRIWQGDALLLSIESGISISENPAFRFDYRANGATEFRAEVEDSEGQSFKHSWTVTHA